MISFRGGKLTLEDCADFYKRETQQIAPAPLQGIGDGGVVATETDAPNRIARRRLDKYRVARGEQVCAQRRILLELGDIAGDNQLEADRIPALVIIACNLPSEVLAFERVTRCKDCSECGGVPKEPHFARHHPLFGPLVMVAVDLKHRRIELAVNRVGDPAGRCSVAIEGRKRERLSIPYCSVKGIDIKR